VSVLIRTSIATTLTWFQLVLKNRRRKIVSLFIIVTTISKRFRVAKLIHVLINFTFRGRKMWLMLARDLTKPNVLKTIFAFIIFRLRKFRVL
jgi:hypothetical protein